MKNHAGTPQDRGLTFQRAANSLPCWTGWHLCSPDFQQVEVGHFTSGKVVGYALRR